MNKEVTINHKEIKELEYLKDTLTQYMNIYYKKQNKEKTKNFNEL